MQLFKRHIVLWAILVLGTQTMAQAQMVKFIMKSRVDCDSLFHVELYVKASALSPSFGFGLGSSSVLLNYDANSFAFESYTPIEFDKTTSTRAATANWENQNWTSNQNNGIFNLVLFKKEGGTNDYLLDTVTEIPIGNLYFKVKKNAPTTASTLSVNRNYTSFLLRGDETKLALEQLTTLSLTPKNLNVPRPIAAITGASRVCIGQTTLLTASGGTIYKWSNAATGAGIRVGAGTYTVTVSNSVGCSATKTATLVSDTLPIAAVAGATSVCTAQTTVLTASGGVTYKWSNAATTAAITVGAGGYTVTATNAAGCSASKYVSVSTSTLTAIISGTTTVCGTATTNLWAGGGSTYKWSNSVTTSANTVSAGTYTVTATNSIGCTATKTVTVVSNPLPVIAIAGANSVCVGQKTTLTASGGTTYRWNNGITTPSVSVGSGTYTVTATSDLACKATKTVTLTSDTLPRVSIAGATSVCTDKTSVLTATGGVTYAWSNGASTPSVTVGAGTYTVTATNAAACTASKSITISTSVVTPTITGNATVCGTATTGLSAGGGSSYVWSNGATSSWIAVSAGTYSVTATNNIGCTATKTTTITSNPVPVVAIAGATSVCTGQNTVLTASGGNTYKWNNAATTAAITIGAGSYTVTATNTVGCSASKSITISTSIPTANISGTTTVCGTATTRLTASGGATYKWSNDTITAKNTVSAGTYTVTATNSIGCTATKTVTVVSNPLPVIAIAGANSVCVGQKTTLTASGGTTYRWNNGITTPSVSVGSGTYTVTATSDLACSATKTVVLASNPLPVVAIAGATSVCTSKTTVLTATGGATYAWSNGATTPSVTVGAGTYSVTATSASGCIASKSITISTSVVTATISGNTSVCGSGLMGLLAGGGSSYAWSNGATASWISVPAGTYTVTATNSLGCTATKTTTITSNPVPVVTIAGATSVCTGQTTVLTASGGGTYKWNNAATTAAITVGAGSYVVTATSAAGCTASKSITITTSVPTATITGKTTVCGTATTSLTASGGATYKWSNNATTAAITVSEGTYTVTATNTIGCTATKSVTVVSNPLPVIAIAGASSVCVGQKTTLTASGGTTYRWNNGITTPSVSLNSGTYSVYVTSDLGCSATKSVTLASDTLPRVAIAGATSVCTDKTSSLTASGGIKYAWSNGATVPSVNVGAGTYSVTATNAAGCNASKSITISTSVVTATLSGNATVCGTATTGLSAGGGSSYTWSNGSTSSWISASAGTYTVTATNNIGCTATKTTTITSNPVPVVAIAGATSVCGSATTTLTASGGGTYKWSNNATTAAITVGAGIYAVTVTSTAGCTATKSITVSSSTVTATITGNTAVCGSATTSLKAAGGSTYKWSNGATTSSITVGVGTYTVTATNSIGCIGTQTATITSNPIPVVAIAGPSNICSGATTALTASGGATYKWSNAATTASITVGAGIYAVTATSAANCSASKSITLTSSSKPAGTTCNDGNANTINDVIQADGCTCKGTPLTSQSLLAASGSNSPITSDKKLAIGYEKMSNDLKNAPFIADFHIFPNPVSDFMNVDLKHYEGKSVTLQVYNIFGKLIRVQQIEKATTAPVFLELNTPANGQYLLRVTTQGQKDAVKTFVISH